MRSGAAVQSRVTHDGRPGDRCYADERVAHPFGVAIGFFINIEGAASAPFRYPNIMHSMSSSVADEKWSTYSF